MMTANLSKKIACLCAVLISLSILFFYSDKLKVTLLQYLGGGSRTDGGSAYDGRSRMELTREEIGELEELEITECLNTAQNILSISDKSPSDILKIYTAEECIVKYAPWCPLSYMSNMDAVLTANPGMDARYRGSKYIWDNLNRFEDKFTFEGQDDSTGERHYWKQTRYWYDILIQKYPNAPEVAELEKKIAKNTE